MFECKLAQKQTMDFSALQKKVKGKRCSTTFGEKSDVQKSFTFTLHPIGKSGLIIASTNNSKA